VLDPQTQQHITRLLALPREIARVGRQLTALRAEKRDLEDDLKKRAAQARLLARKTPEFAALTRAPAQEDFLTVAVFEDIEWEEDNKRLKQLQAAIDKLQVEKDELQDEHQSLRAILEGKYAELLERVLTEVKLANQLSTGRPLA
jgi:TPP-dependent indolepyruvate ferredoxin oxidoreductase alpha subunit